MIDAYCACGHAAQIHAPGGVLADTPERGRGQCTASSWGFRCQCERFVSREHPSVTGRTRP